MFTLRRLCESVSGVSGIMGSVSIDKDTFHKRLKRLHGLWKKAADSTENFAKMDAFVSCLGEDDDAKYSKSRAIQIWLFGYELADSVFVMTDDQVLVLSSKKKIEFLKPVGGPPRDENSPPVELIVRNK
ncbi:unnamed protein product, partial [Cyprideis torosa]